jgi:predicted phosphohydrolase
VDCGISKYGYDSTALNTPTHKSNDDVKRINKGESMAIYAIGDLHLSFGVDKPMDVFGENWILHYEKIKADWLARVKPEDTVILPGDISWAMTFESAYIDLAWIDSLPGHKIIFKGNHDYWWSSKRKMSGVFGTLTFVHNDYAVVGDTAICGTRGWICPNTTKFEAEDEKIYMREGMRLEHSLKAAKDAGYERIIGALHFPPTNELHEPTVFTSLMTKYGVEKVVYGHIHSNPFFKTALQGSYEGVLYYLTACDYLSFKLLALEGA